MRTVTDEQDLVDWTADLLRIASTSTDRSQQVRIGPSEVGFCARKTWHKLRNDQGRNDVVHAPTFYGTAIHAALEAALALDDPFGQLMREVTVERDGLLGHVDLYVPEQGLVVDWKTTTKKNRRYFPSHSQLMQVHLYAWMLQGMGYDADRVALVCLSRDGTERDVKAHVQAYDGSVTAEALEWLADVENAADAPAPALSGVICAQYCEFYGSHCEGKQ